MEIHFDSNNLTECLGDSNDVQALNNFLIESHLSPFGAPDEAGRLLSEQQNKSVPDAEVTILTGETLFRFLSKEQQLEILQDKLVLAQS